MIPSLPGGNLKSTYHNRTLDSQSREGLYQFYFKSGRLSNRGTYRNNRMEGLWENYYDTLSNRLWYTTTYRDGRRDGMLTTWYLSGKVKRKELHQPWSDTVFVKSHRKTSFHVTETYSIKSGHRYDESGAEIPFTPFEIIPKAPYDLSAMLSKMLHYPKSAREQAIEGRVVVQFVIDETGHVQNAEVIRSVSPELDNEALRVINEMPPWQPGIQDDKRVPVTFTLPITFALG